MGELSAATRPLRRIALAVVVAVAAVATVAAAEDDGDLSTMEAFVPEVLDAAPGAALDVSFGEKRVHFGTAVEPSEALSPPAVAWSPNDDALYTVVITNPDIPTMEKHEYGELVHWLVGNVKGGDVSSGDALWEYLSPGPPKSTGVHRYVLLALRQPERLAFADEPRNNATTLDDRFHFSLRAFAQRHGLQLPPAAGNFFKSEWDSAAEELLQIRTFKGQIVANITP